jgi:hypothetical protein
MSTVAATRERIAIRRPSLPAVAGIGLVVGALALLSIYVRTRAIHASFWMDEGLSVGIASHKLSQIPGVLRHDGSPPLYYMLLHVWMGIAGRSEEATHWLSLIFSLLTIPAALWAGWSLFGRTAGLLGAALCALNPFLTQYGEETRMYTLMALLALLATACFLHAFVHRRRRYLAGFAVLQALMLYTHGWGIFYGVGAFAALLVLIWTAEDRAPLIRDGLIAFGGAAVLFLPWLPTLLYQTAHTGAPWDSSPRLGAPVQISRGLMGGDRATIALVLAGGLGLASVVRAPGRSPARLASWALIALPFATLLFAWIVSQFSPAWTTRYFAVVLGPLLLLAAWGLSRVGRLGLVALVAVMIFWANPNSYVADTKSDVRDIAADVNQQLRPGDLVIVGQPEQTPLTWYYLRGGLRYATTIGPVSDPRYMDWGDALGRLRRASAQAELPPLLATLRAGQHVLFVRPLTEGAKNWKAPWTVLVRRRSAQWGAILASDPSLKPTAVAPYFYKGSSTVGNSAVLYTKT